MAQWMLQHNFPLDVVNNLRWWTQPGKPHCDVYLDDRGRLFDGKFPSVDELLDFERWGRKTPTA